MDLWFTRHTMGNGPTKQFYFSVFMSEPVRPLFSNIKTLLQKIFIVYETSTVGIKTKNLPRTMKFGLWSFYNGVL